MEGNDKYVKEHDELVHPSFTILDNKESPLKNLFTLLLTPHKYL